MDADPSMSGRQAVILHNRMSEYHIKDSQIGQNLSECGGFREDIARRTLDVCHAMEKFMTIKAIFINKLEPGINTRNKYRWQELALKY